MRRQRQAGNIKGLPTTIVEFPEGNPQVRNDDLIPMRSPSRTDRVSQQGQHWFFRTREGIDVGGFASQFDAQLAACLLVDRLAQAESPIEARQALQLFLHAPPIVFAGSAPSPSVPNLQQGGRWHIGDSLRRWLGPSAVRSH